jgi:hypothetical protein
MYAIVASCASAQRGTVLAILRGLADALEIAPGSRIYDLVRYLIPSFARKMVIHLEPDSIRGRFDITDIVHSPKAPPDVSDAARSRALDDGYTPGCEIRALPRLARIPRRAALIEAQSVRARDRQRRWRSI